MKMCLAGWDRMMGEVQEEFKRFIQRGVIAARRRIEAEEQFAKIDDESRGRALNVLSYALNIPDIWPDTYKLMRVMISKMEMAGYREGWIPYLKKGIQISQGRDNISGSGDLCLAIGYLEFQVANFPKALTWFERSRYYFQLAGNSSGEGRALNRLAMTQIRQQAYQSGRLLASAALKILDADDADRANSYYVLGTICHDSRNWQEAENHYRHSLIIWEEEGDMRRTAWGLRNLGPALVWQGKYQEAMSCYKRALAILEPIHDPLNKAMTQSNLASVLLRQNSQLDEATKLLIGSTKIFKQLDASLELAKAVLNLGLTFDACGKHEDARVAYLESVALWENLGNIASLCNALDCLGESYLATNEYKKAEQQFQYALSRLKEIEDHPQYDSLSKMLSEHLAQAEKWL